MIAPEVLDRANVVIVVFTIEGCPACEEYKPRFAALATPYQKRYRDRLPIAMLDANDPRNAALAQRLNVTGVPATFAMRKPAGVIRMVGGVPDAQIAWMLDAAARQA